MTDPTLAPSDTYPYRGSWERYPSAPAKLLWGGALAAALLAVAMFALLVLWWGSYGALLFCGTPLAMGVVVGLILNYPRRHRFRSTVLALLAAHVIVATALLLFAVEGLLCLAMAAPLSIPVALLGGGLGLMVALRLGRAPRVASGILLILPLLLGGSALEPSWPLREVRTEVVIDAPPEVVWTHVVGFGELPPPTAAIFRLGIAYPQRARLEGEGVGAIRYCEFSTGPFVEPITVWEPPRRLAFDVVAQPATMHEWSPYRTVHAAHLLEGLQSRRGQFDLVRRADGTTLLRGTTWYELRMGPQAYWGRWSDEIIHRIHRRVLRQIRIESESERESPTAESRLS